MRNRSVVFVVRDKKILVEKIFCEGKSFYSIPGGGIEDGETPEDAAIRELKEECGLDGTIVKKCGRPPPPRAAARRITQRTVRLAEKLH